MLKTNHQRFTKITLLIALPLVLFAFVAERNTWRPRTLVTAKSNPGAYVIQFSPDGEYLSLNPSRPYSGSPIFCEVRSGRIFKCHGVPASDPYGFNNIHLFIDKNHFTYGNNICTFPAGKVIATCPKVSYFIGELSDGKTLLALSWQGGLCSWNSQTRQNFKFISSLPPLPEPHTFRRFGLLADKNTLAISSTILKDTPGRKQDNRGVLFWDLETQQSLFHVPQALDSPQVSTPNGICVLLTQSFELEIWNYKTKRRQTKIAYSRAEWPLVYALSADGTLLACSINQKTAISLWDTKTGKVIRTLNGHRWAIQGLAFSPDGRTLVSSSRDGTILLWRIK